MERNRFARHAELSSKQAKESNGSKNETKKSFSRPSRYVHVPQQEESKSNIKRGETSITKGKNATVTPGGGAKASKKIERKQESRKADDGGKKDAAAAAAEDANVIDANATNATAVAPSFSAAIAEDGRPERRKEKSRPQHNSLQVAAAFGPSEKEKLHRQHLRVRSSSESAVAAARRIQGDAKEETGGKKIEEKKKKTTSDHGGREEGEKLQREERNEDGVINPEAEEEGEEADDHDDDDHDHDHDKGEEKIQENEKESGSAKRPALTEEELDEELLNKLLAMDTEEEREEEVEEEEPPVPRKTRPLRRRRDKTKTQSLGRQDGVVRHMLVRGSKRPPMFPPSADPWPGRL